jgi:hypothetical protein
VGGKVCMLCVLLFVVLQLCGMGMVATEDLWLSAISDTEAEHRKGIAFHHENLVARNHFVIIVDNGFKNKVGYPLHGIGASKK